MPQVTLFTAETTTVTPCFTDESGNSLTYTVASDNDDVATGEVKGVGILVAAHSPGRATITITASNGQASGDLSFGVLVPNRPPKVVAEVDPIRLPVGSSTVRALSNHFSDPDGQALTYSATSSDPATVTAEVDGSDLAITGNDAGQVTVTVTASDGDESVMLSIRVRSVGPVTLVNDRFDADTGDWENPFGTGGFEIADGYLNMWSTRPGWFGGAGRELEATFWHVEASLEANPVENTGVAIQVAWKPNPAGYDGLLFAIGDLELSELGQSQVEYFVWVGGEDVEPETASGFLDDYDPSEAATVAAGIQNGDLVFEISGKTVATFDSYYFGTSMSAMGIHTMPPLDDEETGGKVRADWVKVSGIPAESGAAKRTLQLLTHWEE